MKVGGRPGLPSLIVLMVSVDVKQHLKKAETLLTAIQDLPESFAFDELWLTRGQVGRTWARKEKEKSSGKTLKHVGATILLSGCTSVAEPQVAMLMLKWHQICKRQRKL